jgi:hypothetical protein
MFAHLSIDTRDATGVGSKDIAMGSIDLVGIDNHLAQPEVQVLDGENDDDTEDGV